MSPTIYKYGTIYLTFFSREHKYELPHVHALSNDDQRGSKALLNINKAGVPIEWVPIKDLKPLNSREERDAKKLVTAKKNEILQKWMIFQVYHKKIKSETITRKLK